MQGVATNQKTLCALGDLEDQPYLTMPVSSPASAHPFIFSTICSVNRGTNVIWCPLNFCAACFMTSPLHWWWQHTQVPVIPRAMLPALHQLQPEPLPVGPPCVCSFSVSLLKRPHKWHREPSLPCQSLWLHSGSGVVTGFIPEDQKRSAPLRPQDKNFLNGKH